MNEESCHPKRIKLDSISQAQDADECVPKNEIEECHTADEDVDVD